MSSGSLSISPGAVRLAPPLLTRRPAAASIAPAEDLAALRDDVENLSEFLQSLDRIRGRRTFENRTESVITAPAQTPYGADLGLQTHEATAPRMSSTVELNTTPTSYTPAGPSFSGTSTSLTTIGGIYNGQNGTQTLTFRVTGGNGTVGSAFLTRIEVRDASNTLLENFSMAFQPAGHVFTLGNGLAMSLSSGSLRLNDTFTVNVFSNVGSAPDPTKPFNGTRNDSPNLPPGLAVTAGSFQVNGVAINVLASDSIDSVLAKITQSAANVTATYDVAGESVRLVQKTAGAASSIVVGNDTSGFLAATRLSGAVVSPGRDAYDDLDVPIGELSRFQGVSAGAIAINGRSISVNPASDSLRTLLDRIRQAGVEVGFDESGQRLHLRSLEAANRLTLDDNGTGLLPALGFSETVYEPSRDELTYRHAVSRITAQQARRAAVAVERFAELFSDLFESTSEGPYGTSLRKSLEKVVGESFNSHTDTFRTALGLKFDFRDGVSNPVTAEGEDRLTERIRQQSQEYNKVLFGRTDGTTSKAGGESGLVEELRSLLERTAKDLRNAPAAGGSR